MRVQFPATWSVDWQDLWAVVQWQNENGGWVDVEGWQGTLDEVEGGVGEKTWWVAEADLGKGPFRWAIYDGPGGERLVASEPFALPGATREFVTVEASLGR